jgi:ABC-2 type transport system ATP-binding protein
MPAIVAEDVALRFRARRGVPPIEALRGVHLTVAPGEIVGLLGPNGSGKTTLLRVLAGELRRDRGHVRLLDQPPGAAALVPLVGYAPEGPLPLPRLSGAELLGMLGALLGMPPARVRARATALLGQLGLAPAAQRPHRTYSTGMRRRLAIAAALLAEPRVLLLDEPSAGLDPSGSLQLQELLRAQRAAGVAILLASHRLDEVEQLCDRVCLLDAGRVHAEGPLDSLLGTGDWTLTLRGLTPAARAELEQQVARHGAELVASRPARRHLNELFRELGPC